MQVICGGSQVRQLLADERERGHGNYGEQSRHEAVFDHGLTAIVIGRRRPREPYGGPKGQILKLFHPIPPRRLSAKGAGDD